MRSYFLYILFSAFLFCFAVNCKPKDEIVPIALSTEKRVISVDSVSDIPKKDLQIFAYAYGGGTIKDKIKYAVKVYRLVYTSTYNSSPIKASGLIYLPQGLNTHSAIISAQHGTTFNKSDAPSVSLGFTGMELLASAGYITIMPDYHGYGASQDIDHPYYDAEHSALTVIDMIKATKEFLDETVLAKYNSQLFLAGYSEGGYVTLAAQREIETNPSIGLTLTGVAAGAGGYDLSEMLRSISTSNYYSYPAYLAFIINSYNKVYGWDKPLNYFFRDHYANKLETLMLGNNDGSFVNNQLSSNLDSLLNNNFFSNLKSGGEIEFKKALINNSLTNWTPHVPTRLYHGTDDEIIPYNNSEVTLDKLKKNGSNSVELYPIKDGTHSNSLIPMIQSFIPWFEQLGKGS